MNEQTIQTLLKEALEARNMSYSPYSNMAVGAALLAKNKQIYRGCNIESASFSPTNCAERTAFFKAISEGVRDFEAIAVVGGKSGKDIHDFFPPCGVCRQVMMEFCNSDSFKIILAKNLKEYTVKTLSELLPMGFGPADLK